MEVKYESGSVEWISSIMFWKIVSKETCTASDLRDKRVSHIIKEILIILRDWGIKLGELPYLSAMLNQSLDFNQKEALLELWSEWMPKPLSPDDVDLIAIDRVLKAKKGITLDDIFKNRKQ